MRLPIFQSNFDGSIGIMDVFLTEQHPSRHDFTSVFPALYDISLSIFVLYRPSIDTHEKE